MSTVDVSDEIEGIWAGLRQLEQVLYSGADHRTVLAETRDSVRVVENKLAENKANSPAHEFGNLGGHTSIGPVGFQGGWIFLHGYGCRNCGNAFWTEDDDKRRLPPGPAPCPHCGIESEVPS